MMNLAFKFSYVDIRFPLQNTLISIHTANRMLKSFVCVCVYTTYGRFYFIKLQFTAVAINIYT